MAMFIAAVIASIGLTQQSDADIVVTVSDSDGRLTYNYSGSLNVAGFEEFSTVINDDPRNFDDHQPDQASISQYGPGYEVYSFDVFDSIPTSPIGTGTGSDGGVGSGDNFGLRYFGTGYEVFVDPGYDGAPLRGSLSFPGQTMVSQGINLSTPVVIDFFDRFSEDPSFAFGTITFQLAPTVATPTISPEGGSHTDSVTVSLVTATSEATIYYTTDGSEPTSSSTEYLAPFTLTDDATVRAKAFKDGFNDSGEASASFTVTPTVATPTISPEGGSHTDSVTVSLVTATSEATIYYTTDGSEPTSSSTEYSGAFTLTDDATVKAKAFKDGFNDSDEASTVFTVTPTPDPYTGYYKIVLVIDGEETYQGQDYSFQDGEIGRLTVYFNENNKLRVRGYIISAYPEEGKIPIRGRVNPRNGKIILTSINGEDYNPFSLLKIIKRNNTVVGLKGSGENIGSDEGDSWVFELDLTGYKTRNLPES